MAKIKIKTYDRQELIDLLTPTKGKLKENVFLISVTDPDKKPITKTKPNTLALSFITGLWGPNELTFKSCLEIDTFIKSVLTYALQHPHTDDIQLWIACEEGDQRSTALATYAYEIIPEHLLDPEDWQKQNMFLSPDNSIIYKLYTTQMMTEHFTPEARSTTAIAWDVYGSQNASDELKSAAESYLIAKFKNHDNNDKL